MQKLQILNKKEIKKINAVLQDQYGCNLPKEFAVLRNKDGRIYLINRDFSRVMDENLRFDSMGLYLGKIEHNVLRPSIEGSQIIGPTASKNVIEIEDVFVLSWTKGHEIPTREKESKFILIVKNRNDFLGSGKVKNGIILNYYPKSRQLQVKDEI
jgi:NOL1/NOP2/fmu family ribosome biogenesis protein